MGKTQEYFERTVRVFHVVTDGEVEGRYVEFLRLAQKEGEKAVEDGATGLILFYELELRPFLVEAGLVVGGGDEKVDVCVLMSGEV